jgi:hypothetical protein
VILSRPSDSGVLVCSGQGDCLEVPHWPLQCKFRIQALVGRTESEHVTRRGTHRYSGERPGFSEGRSFLISGQMIRPRTYYQLLTQVHCRASGQAHPCCSYRLNGNWMLCQESSCLSVDNCNDHASSRASPGCYFLPYECCCYRCQRLPPLLFTVAVTQPEHFYNWCL